MSVNHHALSVYQWYNANREMADHHAAQAVASLERDRDPDGGSPVHLGPLGHGLAMQAYLAVQASDLDTARAMSARATAVAERAGETPLSVRVRLIDDMCGVVAGDERARASVLSVLARAGDDFDEIYSSGYSNLTYLDVEQRRLADAAHLLDESIAMTVERDLPICRVWQIGSRGRLHLIRGDWDAAFADAHDVLSGPSAPLACTWPHVVRALVALRRTGDAGDDLDAAWQLAVRYGEPIRLLPVASAIVERMWLTGARDDRLDACRVLLAEAPHVGLEWGRGELAVWLRRLDTADADADAGLGAGPGIDTAFVAEPYRRHLDDDADAAAEIWAGLCAPYDRALALVDTGRSDATRQGLDLLLRLLGDGLTNAELAQQLFISAKTADHHVSAILAELAVGSRRDAARRGHELGLVD